MQRGDDMNAGGKVKGPIRSKKFFSIANNIRSQDDG